MSFSVALAGSSDRALVCAQALLETDDFSLAWVLTPEPKLIGREQKLQANVMQQLAASEQIPAVLVKNKIDDELRRGILALEKPDFLLPDFLLVVDFGYKIPGWLLKLPRQATLNIHPSALPAWRGSSPAQFVLLSNAKASAVSLIKLTPQLDQGPILWQQKFAVSSTWTQTEYYETSFGLAAEGLPTLLKNFTQNKLTAQPQPKSSPTPLAQKLNKADAFIDWPTLCTVLCTVLNRTTSSSDPKEIQIKTVENEPLLQTLVAHTPPEKQPALIEQAVRAFNPWPLVWTKIPTKKGPRRMQIIETEFSPQSKQDKQSKQSKQGKQSQLQLKTVKVAGLKKTPWNQVKNLVK